MNVSRAVVRMPSQRVETRPDTMTALSGEVLEEFRHDSRQSIATILCLVEAALVAPDDTAVVVQRLQDVAAQARSTASLLDELFPARTWGPIVDASAQCRAAVRTQTAAFAGTVDVVTAEDSWVAMSRAALCRVLSNLLQNAVRAAGQDGVVRVEVRSVGTTVVIDVEDDGPGFGGLPTVNGIGLCSARRLVEDAGGLLETGTGGLGGALVRVHLPAVPVSEVSDADTAV